MSNSPLRRLIRNPDDREPMHRFAYPDGTERVLRVIASDPDELRLVECEPGGGLFRRNILVRPGVSVSALPSVSIE